MRIEFPCDGLRLVGELVEASPETKRAHLVVLCHGIPSGSPPVAGDGGYPALARRISALGFDTVHFNFRGTGDSEGDFELPGWSRDIGALLDFLQDLRGECLAAVVGFSGGGAVAVHRAVEDKRIAGLVLGAAPAEFRFLGYDSAGEAMVQFFRGIGVIRNPEFPRSLEEWQAGFDETAPERLIGRLAGRPMLILHGTQDDMVPPEHARRLAAAAGDGAEMAIIEGAGHRLRLYEPAVQRIEAWLSKNL